MTSAVFLDRDGTIIELVHHLIDPADVRLIDGAGEAITALRAAGHRVIVVTNQSVIGRGMLSETGLAEVHAEMEHQLAALGASVDAIYFCPLKPSQKDPLVIEHPMRKPGPGMLQLAANDYGIALDQSWMVGDTVSDLAAGRNAGCRTILVRTGYGNRVSGHDELIDHEAPDLAGAATHIVNGDKV